MLEKRLHREKKMVTEILAWITLHFYMDLMFCFLMELRVKLLYSDFLGTKATWAAVGKRVEKTSRGHGA